MVDVCQADLVAKIGRKKAADIIQEFDEFIAKNNIKGGEELVEKMGAVLDEKVRKIVMTQQERLATVAKYDAVNKAVIGEAPTYSKSVKNFRTVLQSAEDIQKSTEDGFNAILSDVYTKENRKLLNDPKFQKDLMKYLSNGEFASKEVKEIGDSFKKGFNFLLQSKRAAGIVVDSLKGYSGRQFHDAVKIKADDMEWVKFATENFDFERMGIEPDRIDKFIGDMHKDITTKKAYMNDEMTEIQFGTNKKYSEHRSIKFKSLDAEFDYMTKFGSGNFIQNVVKTVDQDAKIVGLGSTLGPRHQQNFEKMMNDISALSDGDFRSDLAEFKRTYNYLKGTDTFGSPRSKLGKSAAAVRKFTDMAKLSFGSLPSTMTDIPYMAAVAETLLGGGSKGYARNLLGFSMQQAKNFASRENAIKYAKRLTTYAEDMNTLLDTRSLKEGVIESARSFASVDAAHRGLMNLTGLPRQNWAAKGAGSKVISSGLADFAESSFDKLKPKMQEMFSLYGVTAKEWDIIRSNGLEAIDGDNFLTPTSLYEKGHHDAGLKLAGVLRASAELGSPTSSVRLNALKASFDPDSVTGVLMRSITQFKSFPISVMRTMEFVARGSENPISNVVATATIASGLGAVVLQMRNFARTGDFKELDPKFAVEAMAQGGAGGLMFDMFSTDYSGSHRSLQADILGPSAGVVGDLMEIGARKVKGQDVGNQVKRALWYNTPSVIYAPATFKYFNKFTKEF